MKFIKRPVWELILFVLGAYVLGFYTASKFNEVLGVGYELKKLLEDWIGILGGAPALLVFITTMYKIRKTK